MTDGEIHNIFVTYGESYQLLVMEFRFYDGNCQVCLRIIPDTGSWRYSSYFLISQAAHYL